MTSKHTPGPWVAHETLVLFPKNAGGFDIRNCPNPESNARLIAAAPDLLDAIRAFVDHGTCFSEDDMREARAAIAKATGETQ